MPQICFDQTELTMYSLFALFIIILTSYWISKETLSNVNLYSSLDKVIELQESLFNTQLKEQQCQTNLSQIKQMNEGGITVNNSSSINEMLNKRNNPLVYPDNIIPSGTIYKRGYDAYQQPQEIGYLTNATGQFPVYGRYKDPGRSDRWEYYTINEGRNRIKIPFSTKNYQELNDNDTISVPDITQGELKFKKYENSGLRYNPNVY
jgi:hypothetical protein